jgi:hypothetical protein
MTSTGVEILVGEQRILLGIVDRAGTFARRITQT